MQRPEGRPLIEVRACSIVEGGTDCVVNASNDSATLGGGVSRALFVECGGEALQAEMREKLRDDFDGVLDEGDCLVTTAGISRQFRFVLHVASVDYRGPKARLDPRGQPVRTVTSLGRIRACTEAALQEAAELGHREGRPLEITFPLLGAGSGGLSTEAAARTMAMAAHAFLKGASADFIARIVFAVPDPYDFVICQQAVTDVIWQASR